MLAQNFHRNRALASDDVWVVEGMHERELLFFLQGQRMRIRIRIRFAEQHHFAAAGFDRVDLDRWRGGGHHDDGTAAEFFGGEGNPLRVVAR